MLNSAFLKLSDCKLVFKQLLKGRNTFACTKVTIKAEQLFSLLPK